LIENRDARTECAALQTAAFRGIVRDFYRPTFIFEHSPAQRVTLQVTPAWYRLLFARQPRTETSRTSPSGPRDRIRLSRPSVMVYSGRLGTRSFRARGTGAAQCVAPRCRLESTVLAR